MEEMKKREFSFDENGIIEFPEGLFGFENSKRFIPIAMEEGTDAIISLESLDDENVSFIAMNPFMLVDNYEPKLSDIDKKKLDFEKEEDLSFYVLAVVKKPTEESTVNLKCPIVVNAITKKGIQIILNGNKYDFRHTLKELAENKTK